MCSLAPPSLHLDELSKHILFHENGGMIGTMSTNVIQEKVTMNVSDWIHYTLYLTHPIHFLFLAVCVGARVSEA